MKSLIYTFSELYKTQQERIIEEYEIENITNSTLYQAEKDILRFELLNKLDDFRQVVTLDSDIEILDQIENLIIDIN